MNQTPPTETPSFSLSHLQYTIFCHKSMFQMAGQPQNISPYSHCYTCLKYYVSKESYASCQEDKPHFRCYLQFFFPMQCINRVEHIYKQVCLNTFIGLATSSCSPDTSNNHISILIFTNLVLYLSEDILGFIQPPLGRGNSASAFRYYKTPLNLLYALKMQYLLRRHEIYNSGTTGVDKGSKIWAKPSRGPGPLNGRSLNYQYVNRPADISSHRDRVHPCVRPCIKGRSLNYQYVNRPDNNSFLTGKHNCPMVKSKVYKEHGIFIGFQRYDKENREYTESRMYWLVAPL